MSKKNVPPKIFLGVTFFLHLLFLLTNRIWSHSPDFGRPKQGQNKIVPPFHIDFLNSECARIPWVLAPFPIYMMVHLDMRFHVIPFSSTCDYVSRHKCFFFLECLTRGRLTRKYSQVVNKPNSEIQPLYCSQKRTIEIIFFLQFVYYRGKGTL